MHALLLVLAILGVLAVLRHLGAALLRALGRTAEGVAAGNTLDARAQRGDLTGMAEATAWRAEARRRRRGALLTTALWAAVLAAPAFTAWTLVIYAACSLLWLLPAGPRRSRPT